MLDKCQESFEISLEFGNTLLTSMFTQNARDYFTNRNQKLNKKISKCAEFLSRVTLPKVESSNYLEIIEVPSKDSYGNRMIKRYGIIHKPSTGILFCVLKEMLEKTIEHDSHEPIYVLKSNNFPSIEDLQKKQNSNKDFFKSTLKNTPRKQGCFFLCIDITFKLCQNNVEICK